MVGAGAEGAAEGAIEDTPLAMERGVDDELGEEGAKGFKKRFTLRREGS
jgi:hypothetical protein